MQKVILSIASRIALAFLKQLAQVVWNSFWDLAADAIRQAESKWQTGTVRKDWVIAQIMAYLDTKRKPNAVQRWAIRKLLERVIAAIIDNLNATVGHDWGETVLDLKAYLAGKIPFID
jgi:hypothetical protein